MGLIQRLIFLGSFGLTGLAAQEIILKETPIRTDNSEAAQQWAEEMYRQLRSEVPNLERLSFRISEEDQYYFDCYAKLKKPALHPLKIVIGQGLVTILYDTQADHLLKALIAHEFGHAENQTLNEHTADSFAVTHFNCRPTDLCLVIQFVSLMKNQYKSLQQENLEISVTQKILVASGRDTLKKSISFQKHLRPRFTVMVNQFIRSWLSKKLKDYKEKSQNFIATKRQEVEQFLLSL